MKMKLVVAALACLALGACNPPSDNKDETKTDATQAEDVKSDVLQKIDDKAAEVKQDVKDAADDIHKKADETATDIHRKADEMSQDVSKKVDEMKKDMTDTANQMPAPEATPPADADAAPKTE